MAKVFTGRGWAFPPHIGPQGGLAITSERSELEQAIQIILGTAPGERVIRANFGCRLHELVFAPNNSQTTSRAQRYVEDALGMWEPRINVKEINVQADPKDTSRLLIEIDYEVKATHDQRSLVFPFYLIPEETG